MYTFIYFNLHFFPSFSLWLFQEKKNFSFFHGMNTDDEKDVSQLPKAFLRRLARLIMLH